MKQARRQFMAMAGLGVLAGCATPPVARYSGPEVTKVLVYKTSRRMYLMHQDMALTAHDIDLGFAPEGHKEIEGDGRTPEGRYWIDRRNPQSDFYLSLGISYPNARDVARAAALGAKPGGDIFIHGQPNLFVPVTRDWTWGCIAVSNDEMREIYAMVPDGTVIDIFA